MKTITIYTAAIVEIDEDKVFAPGRPKTFGWSCTDTDPKTLAKRVTDILKGEEMERNGLEIRRPDLPSMESYARHGSRGEPETFETSEDGTRFIVQFSGPMAVEVSDAEAPEGTIIAAPAGEEETVDILLSEGRFPRTRAAKIEELVEEGAVNNRQEAERLLDHNPICLELIYEKGCGLFAVETEAVESAGCATSPYSGKEILTPDFASDKTAPEGQDSEPAKEASAEGPEE